MGGPPLSKELMEGLMSRSLWGGGVGEEEGGKLWLVCKIKKTL